jgi:putative transposase
LSEVRTCWPAFGHLKLQSREIASPFAGEDLDSGAGMPPRPVLPRQFYLITRRCTQRQLLLRPDRETNNAFTYCLIVATLRYGIDVLLPCAMSNHHHTVIYDRDGRYPEFVEHFHKLLARSQNALRGRWENFWSSEQVCVVRLIDRAAVMDKLVYTATNPVQDHLVDRVRHWPGVNGLAALLAGRSLRARRPQHFFRPDGPMPEEVEMRLTIPPELGPESEVLAELRERVQTVEVEHDAERRQTGRRVLGRRAVLQQSWRGFPSSVEPRRNLRPCVASRSKWHRLEALLRNRAFIEDYTRARDAWREGQLVTFPPGTYWLRRFANVVIAET